VYLFSHKNLQSKIEQNVVISLLLYVRDNIVGTPITYRDEADVSTVSASEALYAVVLYTSLDQRSEDGCFLRA
jgi:hypothetical protein